MAKPACIQELGGPTFQPSFLLLLKPGEGSFGISHCSELIPEGEFFSHFRHNGWGTWREGEASTPPLGVCGLATTEREKEGEEGLGGTALGSKQKWRLASRPKQNGQSHLCDFPRRGLYLAPGSPMFPGFCKKHVIYQATTCSLRSLCRGCLWGCPKHVFCV